MDLLQRLWIAACLVVAGGNLSMAFCAHHHHHELLLRAAHVVFAIVMLGYAAEAYNARRRP